MDTELLVHATLNDLSRRSAARARETEARRSPTPTTASPPARPAARGAHRAGAWCRLLDRLPARARGHAPA